jgi:hypothetical protein
MADTAMIKLRAISPDAGERVDDRMVAIDTFLSVGTMSARLLGPKRKMPGPHLPTASVIERCRDLRNRTTPCWPRIRVQSTALMETRVGALCVRMKHLALRKTSAHVRNSRYVINLAPDRHAHRYSKRCKGSGQSQGPRAKCRLRCRAQCTPDGETNDHREDVNCPFARTLNGCVIATRY